MIKHTTQAAMGQIPYSRPECNVLEIKTEGVLCYSLTGSSADDFKPGDELTDYEQIF